MHERVHAAATGGHVALVGVWDPVSEGLAEFFRATVSAARRRGLGVLVVTLAPDPVATLRGPLSRPSFQDVEYRLWYQKQCGVQSRIVVHLTRREVEEGGAALLLDGIRRHVTVAGLLLKPGQSLGRGAPGGIAAIRDYCARAGIQVDFTDPYRATAGIEEARAHLANGRLARAVELLFQRLHWARPSSGSRVLPWPPGTYAAQPMETPPSTTACAHGRAGMDRARDGDEGAPVQVHLTPCPGGSRLRWPEGAPPWLAFVSGPGDSGRAPAGLGGRTDRRTNQWTRGRP
ncbi:hypothetical protein AB0C81_12105 [Streptomyces roseoverticillatus]|uniref:hypothetical protein n=1 Tax=Streptomyces roseoverticillatus TaxID=66429 RepID=UPI0033F5F73B